MGTIVPKNATKITRAEDVIGPDAEMFANRMRKKQRRLAPWAKREGIVAYRLYDGDIPEIPLVVDWYDGHLHLAIRDERARLRTVDKPEKWVEAMVRATAEALDVPRSHCVVKWRRRQRGSDQYQRTNASPYRLEIAEAGLRFRVDLASYLDTGLFLDHRRTRALVAAEAKGAHMLNLFAYTGTFSVYAARAGARTTTTVDMSRTYLEWARENLVLNGFEDTAFAPRRPDRDSHSSGRTSKREAPPNHRGKRPQSMAVDGTSARHTLHQADVIAFLAQSSREKPRYDVVFVDPPTFSNSKRMEASFDVERDHGALLQAVRRVTRRDGVVYFSTNRRRFHFDASAARGFEVEEITERTVPRDFEAQKPHRCWRLVVSDTSE